MLLNKQVLRLESRVRVEKLEGSLNDESILADYEGDNALLGLNLISNNSKESDV